MNRLEEINDALRDNIKLRKRIEELELWIECEVKPDLQVPDWIKNEAESLLSNKGDL